MRTFLPLPPSAPFAVHHEGHVYIRYWGGPHYPAASREIDSWKQYLTERASDSDTASMLNAIKIAETEANQWREPT